MKRIKCKNCNAISEVKLIEKDEDYGGKYKIYECVVCKKEIRVDE